MRSWRGCHENEGVGGFLESILAVMAVITASSLFLMILSVGAVQSTGGQMDVGDVVDQLRNQGLWPDDSGRLGSEGLEARFNALTVPEGGCVQINYRGMGEEVSFLTLGEAPPNDAAVSGMVEPALLDIEGTIVPCMVEVKVW